nr:CapA family protein [Longimicrobium terrae]
MRDDSRQSIWIAPRPLIWASRKSAANGVALGFGGDRLHLSPLPPIRPVPPSIVQPIFSSGPLRRALRAACFALAASLAAASARAQTVRPQTEGGADTVPGVRVCAGGDVTLGTNLDTSWVAGARRRAPGQRIEALPSPDSLLAPLRPLLSDADIVLLNVEGAVGDGPIHRRKCAPGSTACYAFRMPAASAGAMRRVAESARVIGNVANNHARDDGDIGRRITIRALSDADMHVTGVDTLATAVVTAAGDTVAFLGFAQWIGPDPRDTAAVGRHVRRAAERYRRVLVTMHMGAEGRTRQNTVGGDEMFVGENRGNVIAFARTAVEAGADVVFGAGPHVMRAVEWRGDALIFYSLGNLLTYGPFSLVEPMNRGAIACAVLDEDGRVVSAQLRSTRQRAPGILSIDPGSRAAVLADSLSLVDLPASAARIDPATGDITRRDDAPAGAESASGTPARAPASGTSPARTGERRRP